MSLKLNENSISKLLIFQVYFVFFYSATVDFFNFPRFLIYVMDIINIIVNLYFIYSSKRKIILLTLKLKLLYFWMFLLFFYVLFTSVINLVNPLLIIWGIRNSLRYFLYFFALIIFLKKKQIESIINFFIWFQIPNFLIVLYQFYYLGYSQDSLGGIFGYTVGCNGYVNMYMCIVVGLVVEKYLHKKVCLSFLIYSIISWMIVAGLAELKVAFLEIAIIIIIAILINKPSFRTMLIVVSGILGGFVGVNLIVLYFPEWAYAFKNLKSLIGVGSITGGGYNISRATAFSDINKIFFKDSIFFNIFGYGMGNCEYAIFDFLTSDFYKLYGHYNYRWFSQQMWFLQCGYLGIICFLVFFIIIFVKIKKLKKQYKDKEGYFSFGQIMVILLLINFMYNASLTTEIGYLAFFALSIPFIYIKDFIKEKNFIN